MYDCEWCGNNHHSNTCPIVDISISLREIVEYMRIDKEEIAKFNKCFENKSQE
mgnify:CR=1 FL=1